METVWRRVITLSNEKTQTFVKPLNASKIVGENITAEILALPGILVDFNSGPKVPFPGVLDIGHFHSPRMKPCKSADYSIKVSFHIVVYIRQGESNIFQISTWKAFLSLKIYLLWKIRSISVKGWKPVWIRACPIVLLLNLQQLAIVRLKRLAPIFVKGELLLLWTS